MDKIKNLNVLQEEISSAYNIFFEKLGIDQQSGIWQNGDKELRFATMPHIGAEYLNAPTKIMFVGLDIGKDETGDVNIVQSFEDRRCSLSAWPSNPHMFGTYMEALYFLRPNVWKVVMERYKDMTVYNNPKRGQ